MKKLILALGVLMLSACATTEPKQTVIYVDKPVPFYIVPYPSDIAKPDFEIYKIDKNNYTEGQISKAYRVTVRQYKEYTDLLVKVIDKYKELAIKSKEKLLALQETVDERQSVGNPMIPNTTFVDSNLEHLLDLYATEKQFKEIEIESQTSKVDME